MRIKATVINRNKSGQLFEPSSVQLKREDNPELYSCLDRLRREVRNVKA